MKRIKNTVTALVLAVIIAVSPMAAMAAPTETMPPNVAVDLFAELAHLRQVELTPEAMAYVLYDFDYLVDFLLEVLPTQNIIETVTGFTPELFFYMGRTIIEANMPMPSLLSVLSPDRWEDAPAADDHLSIAADYLFTFLLVMAIDLGGLGHMEPQIQEMVNQFFLASSVIANRGLELTEEDIAWLEAEGMDVAEIERNLAAQYAFHQIHYTIFNTPSVLWFYDLSPEDIDMDTNLGEALGFREEGNVQTEILVPGEVAYLRINSFMGNMIFDSETLFPFYEAIQDYDHLIIDLRGNGGGWVAYFPSLVLSMLIDEPVTFTYYELFIASERTAGFFENPSALNGGALAGIIPVSELLATRDLPLFDPDDAELLDYAIIWEVEMTPAYDNIPFGGEIWLLVDGGSASASESAASISIATGFATVVGLPTAGITGVIYTYAAMPNTGILFRVDLGYTIDTQGRSIEEFGVVPQILAIDALAAVLDIIGVTVDAPEQPVSGPILLTLPPIGGPIAVVAAPQTTVVDGVEFISVRYIANAHGYTVAWDGEQNVVTVTDAAGAYWHIPVSQNNVINRYDTVFMPLEAAREMFVSPLVGTWGWLDMPEWVYIFNPDGTGRRGVDAVQSFTWIVDGNNLYLHLDDASLFTLAVEEWTFLFEGDVLILSSRQVLGMTYVYTRL